MYLILSIRNIQTKEIGGDREEWNETLISSGGLECLDDINQNMFKNENGSYTCAICGKVGVERDAKNRKVNMRDKLRLTWRDSHFPVRAVTKHSGQDTHSTIINLNIIVFRSRNSLNFHKSRYHRI